MSTRFSGIVLICQYPTRKTHICDFHDNRHPQSIPKYSLTYNYIRQRTAHRTSFSCPETTPSSDHNEMVSNNKDLDGISQIPRRDSVNDRGRTSSSKEPEGRDSGSDQSLKNKTLSSSHEWIQEFLSEFLGTFMIIVFGDGSIAQVSCDVGA